MSDDPSVCILCVAGFIHDNTELCGNISSEVKEAVKVGRPEKEAGEMADPLSTGRKRAAAALPIAVGDICDWAFLKEAGGGVVPITGCPGYPASDRHHGPDKNTLNNEVGVNLHKVCDFCHNRWHAANDMFYMGASTVSTAWPRSGLDEDSFTPSALNSSLTGDVSRARSPTRRTASISCWRETVSRLSYCSGNSCR